MDRMERLRDKVRTLPQRPGVYLMKDADGLIIYVGKAKSLKNRVSSYFAVSNTHTRKTTRLVRMIEDFDVILTDTEFEALVLECTLIKRHMPKYNILLKDDKGFPFIRLDLSLPYPKFSVASKVSDDHARYFGPYGGRNVARQVIETITETFRLPTCHRVFPRDINKSRPCLNAHMKRCHAPCDGKFTAEEYRGLIDEAVMLLEGRYEALAENMRAAMEQAAEELLFERAGRIRDRMQAVVRLGERQKVIAGGGPDMDIISYFAQDGRGCIVVLHVVGGAMAGKDSELISGAEPEDGAALLAGYIKQYYAGMAGLPPLITISEDIEDRELIARMLSESSGRKVELRVPARGTKAQLVVMAAENAREEVLRAAAIEEKRARAVGDLQDMLSLPARPGRIEAYDISNMGDTGIVGAMIVFLDGRPAPSQYRRFKMKSVETQDDYASMREMISRRIENYLEGDPRFSELPQLILIDGGLGHVREAYRAASETALRMSAGTDFALPQFFGMVKDDRHRTRGLVSPEGGETGLSARPPVFAMVSRMQDEAHRFALAYNRTLTKKRGVSSSLDAIPGIGEARRRDLLRAFKTIRAIKEADIDALAAVIPRNAAEAVYAHFRSG